MFPRLPDPPRRHGPSAFRILRTLVAVAGVGAVALPVAADPPRPGMTDVLLARAALAAMDDDPTLRDVNLVVSVVDRVAVVGGPVASADVKGRAHTVVAAVRGIREVRNECFVQAGADPLLRAMAARHPSPPRRPFFTDLPPVIPGAKSVAPPEPETVLALADPRPVVVRRPPNPAENVLFGPVGPTGPGRTIPPAAVPFVPLSPVRATPVAARPGDPAVAAEAARRADRRYAGLRVEARDGTLVVAGTAARAVDAWDLARALRGIPGVGRVAVGPVDVE